MDTNVLYYGDNLDIPRRYLSQAVVDLPLPVDEPMTDVVTKATM